MTQVMNDLIRQVANAKKDAATHPVDSELTPEQAARIEMYVKDLGATYPEARDLVTGFTPPAPPPPGHAGAGTGGKPTAEPNMNDFMNALIIRASGR